jgi:hypothetical protein
VKVSWWVATQVVEASDRKRQQHLIKKFIMTADVRIHHHRRLAERCT